MKNPIPFYLKSMLLLVMVLFSTGVFSQTIITVTDCNRNGWVDQRNPNTIAAITTGAAAPPLGMGSLEYTTTLLQRCYI